MSKEEIKILKLAKRLTDLLEKEENRQIETSMKEDGSFNCSFELGMANTASYHLYKTLCKLYGKEPKIGGIKEIAHTITSAILKKPNKQPKQR